MLHIVTSYMKQNKSRKQTLESVQYGLEISLKYMYMYKKRFTVVSSTHTKTMTRIMMCVLICLKIVDV